VVVSCKIASTLFFFFETLGIFACTDYSSGGSEGVDVTLALNYYDDVASKALLSHRITHLVDVYPAFLAPSCKLKQAALSSGNQLLVSFTAFLPFSSHQYKHEWS
jgi:hypothetical protein